MKAIISKENEGSSESHIDETTIDSVNNEYANCGIVVNEVLDVNQEDTDLLIENKNNGVTDSVSTKCNEQNAQENLTEKQSEKCETVVEKESNHWKTKLTDSRLKIRG